MLPGCDAAGAQAVAERLRATVSAAPTVVGELSLRVTCSIGVAIGGGASGADRERLLSAADAALYRAKQAGRDRVVMDGDDRPPAAAAVKRKGPRDAG